MTDEPAELEIGWPVLLELLNSVVSRTRYWWAGELLDDLSLTDAEIDAINQMPPRYRQWVTAQLIDLAETIRESSRDLDVQLMRLTGEMV